MKRMMWTLGLVFGAFAMQVSARELRTVVFKVMQMQCANCEKKVKKNIAFEKGLKSLDTDVKKRTVTIVYDHEKTSVEDLKKGFAKFEYEAKVISDKPVAEKE